MMKLKIPRVYLNKMEAVMMKKIRMMAVVGFALLVLSTFFVPQLKVIAAENNNDDEIEIINNCSGLSDEQVVEIYDLIENNIIQRYNAGYELANYSITFNDFEVTASNYVVDVDVFVDITLVENPAESLYVQGMEEAVESIEDTNERAYAQRILDEKLADLMSSYNVSQRTGFLYRADINDLENFSVDNINLFHRVDITDEEADLSPVQDNECNEPLGKEVGCSLIQSALISSYSLKSSVSYNKDDAVTYATEHATDEPEFSKENGLGSDCANFVSKCINAGGIPTDKDGNWYPSPKAGSYAGTNWMRTGYYNNGGVVPYMTDKGYFEQGSSSSATLGSIIYWNSKSHVALVTSIDQNGNIKYSQHSNVTLANVYYAYSSSMDVTFYVPSI